MGRTFTGASSHTIIANDAAHPVATHPFTLAIWAYVPAAHNAGIMWIGDKDSGGNFGSISSWSSSGLRFRLQSRSPLANDGTAGTFLVNTWHHVCGIWRSATDRELYVNGNSEATGSTSVPVTAIDRTAFGHLADSSPGSYFTGSIAHGAMWNVSLSPSEIVTLSNGVSPLNVRRGSVKGYWPLLGNVSPEPEISGGTQPGVVTGAVASVVNPIVGGRSRIKSWAFKAPAAVGGGRIMSSLAGYGGLAGHGGIAGPHGGLAG